MPRRRWLAFAGACLVLLLVGRPVASAGEANAGKAARDRAMLRRLDAPVLFVKRFNQQGIHIYDTFFKWRPGGGIYILENPADPPAQHRVRPLVGPEAPGTLGNGMYWDPDISYDGTRLLFCYKPSHPGTTSIYEIGVDGKGLRRLTDPTPFCGAYKGSHGGVHDVQPAYLPDGRIIFTSTRQHGLVPCANEGVNILHVMNADGSGIRTVSVNNVNEFDPCVLPDGRILHGRWEYVDKTALTIQSLWTIFPDGTNETALFANNMVHPEALLDARPVPDAPHLIVASFTPHNSPPRGSIGLVDMRRGKNGTQALVNLEHPSKPDHDRGNSCEPWPLSKDLILYSGMPRGHKLNAIMMIDRSGHRLVVHADPKIDCHDPMLVKPRPVPPAIIENVKPAERTGRFYVQDIYDGLVGRGVERGEVTSLRVIEETSRVSPTPGGARRTTWASFPSSPTAPPTSRPPRAGRSISRPSMARGASSSPCAPLSRLHQGLHARASDATSTSTPAPPSSPTARPSSGHPRSSRANPGAAASLTIPPWSSPSSTATASAATAASAASPASSTSRAAGPSTSPSATRTSSAAATPRSRRA